MIVTKLIDLSLVRVGVVSNCTTSQLLWSVLLFGHLEVERGLDLSLQSSTVNDPIDGLSQINASFALVILHLTPLPYKRPLSNRRLRDNYSNKELNHSI